MSFLSRAFSGQPEARAEARLVDIPPWSEVSMGAGRAPRNAMKMVVFFRCVDILAKTVASLPIAAYRYTKNGRVEVNSKLMSSPYPGMTWQNWLFMLMRSLAITGNGFGYITARDQLGSPTAILPLHPDSVRVDPEKGSWWEPAYEIFGRPVTNSADVFHVKAYPEAGYPMGLSPIEYLATTLELGWAAEQYGLRWFKDSANPSGILSSPIDLTEEQVNREMRRWIQANGQGKRYPAVMGGGLQFQTIGIPPNESQFLETRAHQRSDIAMMFGIPPHMIGDTEKSTSWGTGISEQVLGFQKFTVNPWVVGIEQAFELILPRGQFAKFNMDALVRPDLMTRYTAHQMAIQSGMASPNERRAIEDLPPIEGYPGDIYLQPSNFVELGHKPEPTAPNPQADSGEEGN